MIEQHYSHLVPFFNAEELSDLTIEEQRQNMLAGEDENKMTELDKIIKGMQLDNKLQK